MTEAIFFDSYALVEMLEGNENYERFADDIVTTTKMNLFEVYYAFLRKGRKDMARMALKYYYDCAVDFDMSVIADAGVLKFSLVKQKVSMVDCIGYVLAEKLGMRFLTGDKEFENLPNVEFVK